MEKIVTAQAAFSRAVLNQPHHTEGYTSNFSDVEHTAEDTGNTITPMMHIDANNIEWSNRALKIIELMEKFAHFGLVTISLFNLERIIKSGCHILGSFELFY